MLDQLFLNAGHKENNAFIMKERRILPFSLDEEALKKR